MDDILIKSKSLDYHLVDLEENFIMVKKKKVRINLTKCAFEVIVRKFLKLLLTKRGIEVNLPKCKASMEMRSPTIVKEVQRLNHYITTLSRFMPKSVEKYLSFYKFTKEGQIF